jgi:hypothetical protein
MRIDHDADMGEYDYQPLIAPARQNFAQGSAVRLQLGKNEGADVAALAATLEVFPITPRTATYLEHNAIPIEVTDDDFREVSNGKVVTKAYYFSALHGVVGPHAIETITTIGREPGADVSANAAQPGSLLAVVRLAATDADIPAGVYPLLHDSTRLRKRMKE